MTDRWECRYSSCEMMYLQIIGDGVRCWLDHSPQSADVWTFDDVLAAKGEGTINSVFGSQVLEEVKAAIRKRQV